MKAFYLDQFAKTKLGHTTLLKTCLSLAMMERSISMLLYWFSWSKSLLNNG